MDNSTKDDVVRTQLLDKQWRLRQLDPVKDKDIMLLQEWFFGPGVYQRIKRLVA